MLSNTAGATGGELVMERADGKLQKLRQCETGSVAFIQERHVTHTALRSDGPEVRMIMVCPMWPSSPFIRDDTFLTYTRTISDTSELYGQYADYRFGMLIERLRSRRAQSLDDRHKGVKLGTGEFKALIQE
ncbi:hypothetical protein F52700_5392 [Fusarium sp. NRRL 52700]|nr:hypothetical protein F52700_5392 [Fusarium sp. NRRL 52700]